MAKIRRIEPNIPSLSGRKRVAAYARVSMETELLHHSLSAQVSHYSSLIQSNPEWEYAGVYADEGITGTSTKKRDEFNRLMKDCDAGKIDLVLVKSISRFASAGCVASRKLIKMDVSMNLCRMENCMVQPNPSSARKKTWIWRFTYISRKPYLTTIESNFI